ncbi:hypothetical protein C0J52_21139 [Blattella germanica]|nr:hypothetical protein C0J52_21139 [Blattella germanica]
MRRKMCLAVLQFGNTLKRLPFIVIFTLREILPSIKLSSVLQIQKTAAMIFRKGGRLSTKDTLYLENRPISFTNNFKYLGITLQTTGGTFTQHVKGKKRKKVYHSMLSASYHPDEALVFSVSPHTIFLVPPSRLLALLPHPTLKIPQSLLHFLTLLAHSDSSAHRVGPGQQRIAIKINYSNSTLLQEPPLVFQMLQRLKQKFSSEPQRSYFQIQRTSVDGANQSNMDIRSDKQAGDRISGPLQASNGLRPRKIHEPQLEELPLRFRNSLRTHSQKCSVQRKLPQIFIDILITDFLNQGTSPQHSFHSSSPPKPLQFVNMTRRNLKIRTVIEIRI